VGAQFAAIGYLVWRTDFVAPEAWAAVQLLGGALALWAIAAMRRSRLRIRPEPSPEAQLVTEGPYRRVRHPMYTALLLVCWPPALAAFRWDSLLVAALLTLALVAKLRYEERLLVGRFPGYAEYRRRSAALLPGF
jgi:protein-S-isoprenylcysteine O-methyltransferase Ste14